MSIFEKIFHSEKKINQEQVQEHSETSENEESAIIDFDDIPEAPPMNQALEERRKFDEMVKKGYDFARRSDLAYIDENGKFMLI